MTQIRKRGKVTKTAEEMAEETFVLAVGKIRAYVEGESNDRKGAAAAQKEINRYIRLRNQNTAIARSALSVAWRAAKKSRRN